MSLDLDNAKVLTPSERLTLVDALETALDVWEDKEAIARSEGRASDELVWRMHQNAGTDLRAALEGRTVAILEDPEP